MNSAKRPQTEIKVIYYTDSSIIGEKRFNSNITLNEILTYFQNNLKTEETYLKPNYSFNGEEIINKSTSISDLITKNTDFKINKPNQIEVKIEIGELFDVDDLEDEIFDKILIPYTEQPFQIIIYQPLDNSIGIKKFPENILSKYNLNEFNESSAFLNTKNYLFLSNNEIFCVINKNNFNIEKYKMPITKKNHSMLYIPGDFILFAGGETLETFFFDIEKSKFIKWGKMNSKIVKPSLFLYGDYIYSFKKFNDNDSENNYFERASIFSKNNEWEKIYPEYENENEINNYLNSCYGVSKSSKGNILFIGGNGDKCLLYFPLSNKLFFSEYGINENLILDDKNVYKIDDLYNISIPSDFFENQKIVLINKKDNSLFYIDYNEIAEKMNERFLGKIEIKTSEKNKFLKNINNLRNNNIIDKKNEKQQNQEIQIIENKIMGSNTIKIDFDEIIENQEIKYDNMKKDKILYLPDSIMINQIVSRQVKLNNNNNNINKEQNNSNVNTEYVNNVDESTTDVLKIEDLNAGNEELITSIPFEVNTLSKKKINILYIHDSVFNDKITKRELLPIPKKVKIYKKLKILSNNNTINSIQNSTSRKNIGFNKYINTLNMKTNASYEEDPERNNINYTARNSKKSASNSINAKYKNLLNTGNKINKNIKKEIPRIKIDLMPRRNNSNLYLNKNFYSKKLVSQKVSKEKAKRDNFKNSHKKNRTKIFNESNKIMLEDLNGSECGNISNRIVKIPRRTVCSALNNSDIEDNKINREFVFNPNK